VSIFDYLNVQLKRIQENTNVPSIPFIGRHYFYYGDLFGNRAPISDPRMTGSVVGITGDTTLENLALQYYGVMEFLALQTRHIISEMNNAGHSITSIFISGSQSRNPILVSLIASACGMPVVVPKYTNGAVCYGAALLGIKASTTNEEGESEGLWAVMSRLNQPGNVCEPELGSKDLLDVKYRVFLEQCERQRVFRQWVDEVTIPNIISNTRS
jgi:ribulose kinase